MLRAPIYRRLIGYSCNQPGLFAPNGNTSEKLSCLIVEADAHGRDARLTTPDNLPLELRKLSHLQDECNFLKKLFESSKGIGNVMRLVAAKDTRKSFRDRLLEVFQSESWDIVHYAGHSYFSGDSGYVFFPPQSPGDFPDKMNIAEFAAHLTGTRFLYLSSCQSSEDSFVLALANCNIASAIGYRWPVDDEHSFYCAQIILPSSV